MKINIYISSDIFISSTVAILAQAICAQAIQIQAILDQAIFSSSFSMNHASAAPAAPATEASDGIDEPYKLLWSVIPYKIQNPSLFENILEFSEFQAVSTKVARATKAASASAAAETALKKVTMACSALEEAEEAAEEAKAYVVQTAADAFAASSNALAAFEPCTKASASDSYGIGYGASMALNAFEKATEASAAAVPAAQEYEEALTAVADAKRHLATVIAKAQKDALKAYEAAAVYHKIART